MSTPRDLWQRAEALDAEAESLRVEAIRLALEATGYRAKPAAAALGVGHTSVMRMLDGRLRDTPVGREYQRRKVQGRPKVHNGSSTVRTEKPTVRTLVRGRKGNGASKAP